MLIANVTTSPLVLLYKTDAKFAGTAAISISLLTILGVISSTEFAIVNS